MKKTLSIIGLALVATALIFSCNKDAVVASAEKFETIRQLPSAAAIRIAFQQLPAAEKAGFWKYHLAKDMVNLPATEKDLVKEIYNQISTAVYEKNSGASITFTTLILPEWIKKASAVISKDKLFNLFYFMEGTVAANAQRQVKPVYDESAPDCLCNIGSSYTCKKRTISVSTSNTGVTEEYGSCSYSASGYICDRDDYGCGWGGLWSCNGNFCSF